jgi:hypothetical protein
MCLNIELSHDNIRYLFHVKSVKGWDNSSSELFPFIVERLTNVATEDVVVYKNLREEYPQGKTKIFGRKIGVRLYSPNQGFIYEINKLYKADLTRGMRSYIDASSNEIEINDGLHAWATQDIAVQRAQGSNYSTWKAIIPKGGRYFVGKNGDIVSDSLIIKRWR